MARGRPDGSDVTTRLPQRDTDEGARPHHAGTPAVRRGRSPPADACACRGAPLSCEAPLEVAAGIEPAYRALQAHYPAAKAQVRGGADRPAEGGVHTSCTR